MKKQKSVFPQKSKTPVQHSRQTLANRIKELVQMLLTVWLVTSSVIEASKVPTGSMEKTILTGDFMFINKFVYGPTTPRFIPYTNIELPYFRFPSIKEPEKNDIIAFKFPGNRDKIEHDKIEFYLKRIIGEPGDTVEIINRVVFVNGKEFTIPTHIQYLKEYSLPPGAVDGNIFPKGKPWNADNYGPIVIPQKGDVISLNLNNIQEWETFINREYDENVVAIKNGKIIVDGFEVTSYTVKQNYYFGMGDNRDDSLDSRYWGFIPRDSIIGSPVMLYWSWNQDIPFTDLFGLLGSVRFNRIAKLIN